MHTKLSKLLQSKGIKDITELSEEERIDFEKWEKVLSKEELTMKDVNDFCEFNVAKIERMFQDIETPKEKIERLVLQHSIYKSLIYLIGSPKAERAALETQLTALLE